MSEFVPLNDLESSLVAAQGKKITIEAFIRQLLECDLALPTANEVQNDGAGFQPILFEKQGTNMLAAFTDKSRALQLSHVATYCMVMNALEVLRRIPQGYGVVINPGFTVGLELSPDGIAQIVRDFA
jgi:hypothetical protein